MIDGLWWLCNCLVSKSFHLLGFILRNKIKHQVFTGLNKIMKELFPETPTKNPSPHCSEVGKKSALETSTNQKQTCWDYIKAELEGDLPNSEFLAYIAPIKAKAFNEEEVVLFVPSMSFYQSIVDNYLEKIERCKNKLGFEHLSLVIDLENEKQPKQPPKTKVLLKDNLSSAKSSYQDTLFSETLSRKTRLNSNYVFENFVNGPSNQFALAACKNVVENPGETYNPLFIYGSTGLGKTHLLHAVGNFIFKNNPRLTIAYISSERFMNELIYCLRHNKISAFRKKYRGCDIFLMDDIQFISGNKAATQEEFFHTFNNLYEAKRQIIVTSDLFPQEIPDIEERLRNRFQWGLIADIQPPDAEHRMAILFQKAKQLDIKLSGDVAEYVASKVKRNVRELEGVLHRLNAFAVLQGRSLNLDLAHETFCAISTNDGRNKNNMLVDFVQKEVAEHFSLKLSDLKSKKRHKAFTVPRQIAMYLARKYSGESFPEIGERFGGKDHTTVMHATKKIESAKKTDLDIMNHVESLERTLERLC